MTEQFLNDVVREAPRPRKRPFTWVDRGMQILTGATFAFGIVGYLGDRPGIGIVFFAVAVALAFNLKR